jgi:hypothetical protein
MNKAAIASLLAVSAFGFAPALVSYNVAFAQPQAPAGQIVMPADEQADYDKGDKATSPAAQAAAFEAYLTKYPKSQVKNYVLIKIMIDYSQVDPAKAITAADNVLQVIPDSLQAYVIEVAYRKDAAEKATDPATKQSGLDASASFAQKGINVAKGPKPADSTQDDWDKLTAFATPTFYAAIGEDALNKKDGASAVAAYKSELAAMPPAQLATPAALQETFFLGQAYYSMTPPDYLNCAFYTTRAAALAPAQFQAQLQSFANFCFRKQHGNMDGYDKLVAAAKASLTPPDNLASLAPPAPTDKDIAKQLMASTKDEDIPKLATGDKEFVLANDPDDAAKVWDSIKGKSVEIPGALVIESSPTVVKVAVSDDAVQGKKADFTFNLKPLEEPAEPKTKTPVALAAYKKAKAAYDKEVADDAAATAVGQKVTLQGTYDSYTPSPIMITMSDGAVVLPKATPAAAPHRPAHR